ncbi:MAG TPA: hypothetical protein VII11_02805 [Bacteroidota bacterium]
MNEQTVELHQRALEEDELYERYAASLEKDHTGEYVVVSKSGEVLVSKDDLELLQTAIQKFGRGNFVFRRIGYKALGQWR